jgi:hypothetical protein
MLIFVGGNVSIRTSSGNTLLKSRFKIKAIDFFMQQTKRTKEKVRTACMNLMLSNRNYTYIQFYKPLFQDFSFVFMYGHNSRF